MAKVYSFWFEAIAFKSTKNSVHFVWVIYGFEKVQIINKVNTDNILYNYTKRSFSIFSSILYMRNTCCFYKEYMEDPTWRPTSFNVDLKQN